MFFACPSLKLLPQVVASDKKRVVNHKHIKLLMIFVCFVLYFFCGQILPMMSQGLTEEFKSLKELDLKNSSLTHIKLFPKLPSLTKLDLSENRLSKGLEVRFGNPESGFQVLLPLILE
jgi:Leucine-rich repeat (LRR) protein